MLNKYTWPSEPKIFTTRPFAEKGCPPAISSMETTAVRTQPPKGRAEEQAGRRRRGRATPR